MPFVLRDATGQITRILAHSVPGAEGIRPDSPELIAFLEVWGVPTDPVKEAFETLRRTDIEMSRAIEDVITALLKKSILKLTDLPKAVQERIALRVRLRLQIQEAYERASQLHKQADDKHPARV